MLFFRLAAKNAEESSVIVLQQEGDVGLYNRANRGLYHFIESGLSIIAALPLAFFTYTIPTIILVAIYCIGRAIYQVGYTHNGFGGHYLGFAIDRISVCTITGFLLISAIKTFGMENDATSLQESTNQEF